MTAAATQFAALDQPIERAKTWLDSSMLYERSGNLSAAIQAVERAYEIFQRFDLPMRIAACQKNSGIFQALLGSYDRGIQSLLQAHAGFLALDQRALAAGCDLNLGNIAYYAGLGELALAAYQRAETAYINLDQQGMRLLCRRNQVFALHLSGKHAAALQLLDELAVTAVQLDHRLDLANIFLARGQVLADLGRVDESSAQLTQAEERFRALGNLMSAGECLLERGRLLLGQHDLAAAETCLRAARPLLHDWPIHQWRIEYGLGRCAELRGDPADAFELYRSAAFMVAQQRRRLANEHASSGLFKQARSLIEDAIRLAWKLERPAQVLELDELQRALALLAQLRAEQVRAISGRASDGIPAPNLAYTSRDGESQDLPVVLERRLRRRTNLPVTDDDVVMDFDLGQLRMALQQPFGHDWTLLVYVPCGRHLLIVTVDPARIAVTATDYDHALKLLLQRLTAPQERMLTYLGPDADGQPAAASWSLLSTLGDRLIPTAVRARLHPDHRLLIVPSGALHNLPWAALRLAGNWLVDLAIPQLLPGLQIWQTLQTRPVSGGDALIIGVSSFNGRAADLAGVPATLDLIAHQWPRRVTRLEEATLAAIVDLAGSDAFRNYCLIHFATHGQLVSTSGLFAHLKLADDDLHYDEIVQLQLAGALVVLAACEGAAPEVLPGEEVLSLSRAFLVAGARDVIAGIWQLYDETAPGLLGLLYSYLVADHDPPTALALAQRAWLRRHTGDQERDALFRAPLVWAGLLALGAGGSGYLHAAPPAD